MKRFNAQVPSLAHLYNRIPGRKTSKRQMRQQILGEKTEEQPVRKEKSLKHTVTSKEKKIPGGQNGQESQMQHEK